MPVSLSLSLSSGAASPPRSAALELAKPEPSIRGLADLFQRPENAALKAGLLSHAAAQAAATGTTSDTAGLTLVALLAGDTPVTSPVKKQDLERELKKVEAKIAELRKTRGALKTNLERELGGIDQQIRDAERDVASAGRRYRELKNGIFGFLHEHKFPRMLGALEDARRKVDRLKARRATLHTDIALAKAELSSLEKMEKVLEGAAAASPQTAGRPGLEQRAAMLGDALEGLQNPDLHTLVEDLREKLNVIRAKIAGGTGATEIEALFAEIQAPIEKWRKTAQDLVPKSEKDLQRAEQQYNSKTPHEWRVLTARWLESKGPGIHVRKDGPEWSLEVIGMEKYTFFGPIDDESKLQSFRDAVVANHAALHDLKMLEQLAGSGAAPEPATHLDLRSWTQSNLQEQVAVLMEALRTVALAGRDIAELRGQLDGILASLNAMLANAEAFNRIVAALLVEVAKGLFASAGLGPVATWLARGVSFAKTLEEKGLGEAFEQAVTSFVAGAVTRGIVDATGSKELAAALLAVSTGVVADKTVRESMGDALLAAALASLSGAQRTAIGSLLEKPSAATAGKIDVVLSRPHATLAELASEIS